MIRILPPPGTVILLAATLLVAGHAFEAERQPSRADLPEADAQVTEEVEAEHVDELPHARLRPDAFYSAIAERPLFTRGRRPAGVEQQTEQPEAPTAPTEQIVLVPPDPPDLRLQGLMLEHDHRAALIAKPSGPADWYAVGADVDGWRIVEVSEDSVTIENSGVTHTINLYKAH